MTENGTGESAQVRAQDDLYRHVNGTWLSQTKIRDDRPLEGTFGDLRDTAEEAVKEIILNASSQADPDELTQKIGDLYAAYMDQDTINAKGLSPIQERLARIEAVESVDGLLEISGELFRAGVGAPFSPYASPDAGDPERIVLHLHQGGLGLPDESYYHLEEFAGTRTAYRDYAAQMFALAGLTHPDAKADAVLALETSLASHHLDKVSSRDPQKTYNLLSAGQLAEVLPEFTAWAQAAGIGEEKRTDVVINHPDFFYALSALLKSEDLAAWRAWLSLRVLNAAAPYLSDEVDATRFAFYGTTLSGTPEQKERWKRAVGVVEGALGEAIGELYVDQHFPPAAKERMEELVGNLVAAYRESITKLSWMGEATRKEALIKLESFRTKIGYPEKWTDYSAVHVDRDDLLGSVESSVSAEIDRELDEIGKPIDHTKWLMTPQTVNAYYHPLLNEIVFPAAILQPPFFDLEADDAWNYGAIGAVIGHEIGHGFDDQGSQYDGTGTLRNWWTDDDRAAFTELTSRLVAQFNALEVSEAPGSFVNGELTLGENIGDLGGLGIAHKAYLTSLAGAEAPVIDGESGHQRFFRAWATGWRQKIRGEEAKRRVTIDPHSPNEFRTNAIVKNLGSFHEAYQVGESDAMWLAPEERVTIW